MHDYRVRAAVPDDYKAILGIYAPYILGSSATFEITVPAEEEFLRRTAGIMAAYPYYVCERDGVLAGYAYASPYGERRAYRYSVDLSVYVAMEYRNEGIGRRLYSVLLPELCRRGFYNAYAVISAPNEASEAFHRSFGFEMTGRMHACGRKLGEWHDVMYYEKLLRDHSVCPED